MFLNSCFLFSRVLLMGFGSGRRVGRGNKRAVFSLNSPAANKSLAIKTADRQNSSL
jgi:hypothetical protein